MIDGFDRGTVEANGLRHAVHRAGRGAPLILLHGYPQSHRCWSKVAPRLAETHDVIVPDLRGYGESDAPPDDEEHTVYSKRQMARDVTGIMDALGIGAAHVLGHDRGGRVSYRLALDAPERVRRLGIVEIVPTGDWWRAWSAEIALAAYHWTFLAQPAPFPERMISADPVAHLEHTLSSWTLTRDLSPFGEESMEAYRTAVRDPARVAAMCADYRAGATTDRRHDEEDRAAGRRIAAPLRFLWSEHGFPARTGDPASFWRAWAGEVTDASCRSGHFAMEEVPAEVLAAFEGHFED